jgi:hypothetical protein
MTAVSEPWRPSIGDICSAFRDLADEVSENHDCPIDPGVEQTIRHLLEDLELFVPGLDPSPDPDAGQAMSRAAQVALERGNEREGVIRSLRGLSFAPHDPTLHYALSSACFELGRVELAFRLLCHALWIHPGYHAARQDLEAISAFLEGDENERAA